MLLLVRVMDDVKDYDTDVEVHPDRLAHWHDRAPLVFRVCVVYELAAIALLCSI